MEPGGFCSRLELSIGADCTQLGRKPVRMRAHLRAMGQMHAGIPQDAAGTLWTTGRMLKAR